MSVDALTTTALHTVAALQAENTRLRAIVDRVDALVAGARGDDYEVPADGTLAVVTTRGGWQNQPETEHVYARADRNAAQLEEDGLKAEWETGAWWPVGSGKPVHSDRVASWGELNWLDDPACDRGSVSIETYVSVDDLEIALRGDS